MRFPRMALGILPLALIALAGCGKSPASVASSENQTWTTVAGTTAELKSMMGTAATVFITLDPECPYCQLYAHDLQALSASFSSGGVKFVGLYPGPFMDREDAAKFSAEAGFGFPQVMDGQCELAMALQARVTPECFITDPHGTVVYRGAFDDRAIRQGRKKIEVQKQYLRDALTAFLRDGKPQAEVVAVGCIVECGE